MAAEASQMAEVDQEDEDQYEDEQLEAQMAGRLVQRGRRSIHFKWQGHPQGRRFYLNYFGQSALGIFVHGSTRIRSRP